MSCALEKNSNGGYRRACEICSSTTNFRPLCGGQTQSPDVDTNFRPPCGGQLQLPDFDYCVWFETF